MNTTAIAGCGGCKWFYGHLVSACADHAEFQPVKADLETSGGGIGTDPRPTMILQAQILLGELAAAIIGKRADDGVAISKAKELEALTTKLLAECREYQP